MIVPLFTDRHKHELESLKEKDPEFFQFLEENDKTLLQFGEGDSDDEEVEDFEEEYDGHGYESASDEEAPANKETSKKNRQTGARGKVEVTEDLLKAVVKKCVGKAKSTTALRQLVLFFRAACIPQGINSTMETDGNDSEEEDEVHASAGSGVKNLNRYVISSPEVYEKVMIRSVESISKYVGQLMLNVLSVTASSSLPPSLRPSLLHISSFSLPTTPTLLCF